MVIGLLLAIVLIAVTGGLGVLALAEVPIAGALVAMFVVERRLRRSRARPTRARRAR